MMIVLNPKIILKKKKNMVKGYTFKSKKIPVIGIHTSWLLVSHGLEPLLL